MIGLNEFKTNVNALDYWYALTLGNPDSLLYKTLLPFREIIWKSNGLRDLFRAVKNWYDVILLYLGFKQSTNIIFRVGNDEKVYHVNDMNEFRKIYKAHIEKLALQKLGAQQYIWLREIPTFYEVFVMEIYSRLNVAGKDVLDIGAFLGDTAIYFALKGARKIYAYEPYPKHYELAKHYIRLAGLEKKITLFNMGVNCHEREVILPKDDIISGARVLKPDLSGVKVKIITLKDIAEGLGTNRGVLKVDCEGCEYGTILCSDNETLGRFDEIMIEYHHGYKNLVEKLRNAGFRVRYTRPRYSYKPYTENPIWLTGYIYATKI